MKKTFVSIFIALLLVSLTTATTTLARSAGTVLIGTEHMYFGIPGQVWVADGLVQQRDVPLTGSFDFGSMWGTETQIGNASLDPVTGNGQVWGIVIYTDTATGVTCSGIRVGKLTNFLITAKVIAPCSDGSLLRGTVQDTMIIVPPGSPVPTEVYSDFSGELLSH